MDGSSKNRTMSTLNVFRIELKITVSILVVHFKVFEITHHEGSGIQLTMTMRRQREKRAAEAFRSGHSKRPYVVCGVILRGTDTCSGAAGAGERVCLGYKSCWT